MWGRKVTAVMSVLTVGRDIHRCSVIWELCGRAVFLFICNWYLLSIYNISCIMMH